jgi:hypothetical protein
MLFLHGQNRQLLLRQVDYERRPDADKIPLGLFSVLVSTVLPVNATPRTEVKSGRCNSIILLEEQEGSLRSDVRDIKSKGSSCSL